MSRLYALLIALVLAVSVAGQGAKARPEDKVIRMAVTSSFHNSGLAAQLLPEIRKDLGLEVQLLVVGSGQALRLGRAGDVDALLTHAPADEALFVAQGFGTHRREIMYNDFVLIGPKSDPARAAQAPTILAALTQIATARATFVSRGDNSGTHKEERALWAQAGFEGEGFSPLWYREVGAGMGAALNTASGLGGYILSDRGSWLSFGNKRELRLLFAGDPALFNQYALVPVNPRRHPHVRADLVGALEQWLTSARARALIDGYQLGGEALFTFNGAPSPAPPRALEPEAAP